MIADVKFEEYVPALIHCSFDLLELTLVQLDVRDCREGLEGDVRILYYSLII